MLILNKLTSTLRTNEMPTLFRKWKIIHAHVTTSFGKSNLSLSASPSQDAFVELYDRQRESVFSCSWPSIKTVFGLAALGAASLTIGAYLTQKWTSPLFQSASLFISASSSFSWCLSFFFPFIFLPPFFLRCPWPLRDNLQTLLNLFKASPRKLPLPCLFVSKQTQIKTAEETRGETHRAKDAF